MKEETLEELIEKTLKAIEKALKKVEKLKKDLPV